MGPCQWSYKAWPTIGQEWRNGKWEDCSKDLAKVNSKLAKAIPAESWRWHWNNTWSTLSLAAMIRPCIYLRAVWKSTRKRTWCRRTTHSPSTSVTIFTISCQRRINHLIDGFWLGQRDLVLKSIRTHWERARGTLLFKATKDGFWYHLPRKSTKGSSEASTWWPKEKTMKPSTILISFFQDWNKLNTWTQMGDCLKW